MASIGDVFLRVVAELKGFTASITKEAGLAGDQAGKTLAKSMGKSLSSNVKGGILQGLGIGAGLGTVNLVAQGLHTVVEGVFDTIDAASNLRESMSLTGQVFEGATGDMETWAEGAADAFGESKREALDFAAKFGTAFKNVGMSLDDTADKSKTMTRLAADLASAFNSTGEEAAVALRSGLLGESEPLRRFGVFLSEAAVSAKAASMGIAKVGDKLSDGQKVAARYALIMEQTADSQGMFGRDTESLADAQKSAAAEFENLSAEVGEKLLPIMVDLAHAIKDDVIPAVEAAIPLIEDLFRDLSKEDAVSDQVGDLQRLGDSVIDLVDRLTFWDDFETQADGRRRRRQGTVDAETEGILRQNLATKTAAERAKIAADNLKKIGPAGTTAAAGLRDVTTDARGARKALERLHDVAKTALNDVLEAVYGPAILAGREAGIKQDINETTAALDKAKAAGDKLEIKKLRGELAQEKADLLGVQAEEAALGLKPAEDSLNTWLGYTRGRVNELSDAAKSALYYFDLIGSSSGTATSRDPEIFTPKHGGSPAPSKPKPTSPPPATGNGIPIGARASGGPVTAGWPYVVGERGPELFVPRATGGIMSAAATAAVGSRPSGGGDTNLNLTINGVPEEHIGGEVLDKMQRLRSIGTRSFNGVR